jgi:hypothetical protein
MKKYKEFITEMGIFNNIARALGGLMVNKAVKAVKTNAKVKKKKAREELAASDDANERNLRAHSMVYGEAKRRADERYWEDPDKYDNMPHPQAQKELFHPDNVPNYQLLRKRLKSEPVSNDAQRPFKSKK